ncbi:MULTISPECIES: DUF2809 domain-containing protein [unclassified Microbacterium]|uniref:ribosomal maturation YjgA family protein n=1 Tax=unclassified Microbacterium TaxID=2609290 RepID=UPI000DE447A7|nr:MULTISPECIES: DUF2809 domain-containing protein [unclassified Microbacterium]NYF28641.1 hypothetical protein [Microbacterium sp. JAI119]RBO71690.1 DUF2809 domain-containing protein [Microbacterium sp. H6]
MTIDAAVRSSRRRIVLAVLAVATVAIGLVIHRSAGGVVGDVIGDALYAVLIYLLVALIAARWRPFAPALVAFVFCAGVELFQLTGIPREWGSALPPIRHVLGSGFDGRDILVYAGAVAMAALVDLAVSRAAVLATPGNAAGRPPEGERPV